MGVKRWIKRNLTPGGKAQALAERAAEGVIEELKEEAGIRMTTPGFPICVLGFPVFQVGPMEWTLRAAPEESDDGS